LLISHGWIFGNVAEPFFGRHAMLMRGHNCSRRDEDVEDPKMALTCCCSAGESVLWDFGRWNSEMEPEPMLTEQNSVDTNRYGVVMEPFSAPDQEKRIRVALGLAHGPLPEVQSQWLHRYYEYLTTRLSLPFDGEYAEDISSYRQLVALVTVVALLYPGEHGGHEEFGLLCRARRGTQEIELPLADVELPADAANSQLIEDYWYWFWNWRFDPKI
jgi:hypothetical protein